MSDIQYVMVMHDGSRATKFMSEDYCKDLMAQLAAAQSGEVCTKPHADDVLEFCQACKIESLQARLAEAERELSEYAASHDHLYSELNISIAAFGDVSKRLAEAERVQKIAQDQSESIANQYAGLVLEVRRLNAELLEIGDVRARLAKYGTHLAGCESWRHPTPDGTPDPARCDCGWTADDAASQPSVSTTDADGVAKMADAFEAMGNYFGRIADNDSGAQP